MTFFKSAACPRCYVALRELMKLREEFPDLEIETIDVLAHPIQAAKRGIYFVPALQAGARTLTMIYPTRKTIRDFIARFYDDSDDQVV